MENKIVNILLAEDDRGTALRVQRELERHGFVVTVVNNGREALIALHSRSIDLLITDVVMPGMDGVDLYLELKKHKDTATLPVIIITDKQMFQEAFAALGVDHFVDKALNINVLIQKISEVGNFKKDVKHYCKVLISGLHGETSEQMSLLLKGRDCLVSVVERPEDLVEKALVMKPHIILVNLMIEGNVAAKEVISALKCYDYLKETAIVTYFNFSAKDVGRTQLGLDLMNKEAEVCKAAGAAKFIGRFNRNTFLESLKEFGVS